MNKIRHVFTIIIIFSLLWACAKQSSPMGGPKDENPPVLLETNPKNESTNTKPTEINLEFNEFVKLDNPTKQIIITPKINTDEVEFLAVRNRVNIKLNQELEDSTTYVFNFQKSIQDITESNPAENLRLVFSTGNEIDSLRFSGSVDYIFPNKNKEFQDILVGLYNDSDTTDLFTDSPYYISQVDSAGKFQITNIKEGKYRAYAWHDDNNSLKAEFRNEAYGFLGDPVEITEDITGVHMNLFKGDLSDLKINRSASSGTNYDIIISKSISDYDIIHPEKNEKLFFRLSDKNLRLYHTELRDDSTQVQILLQDSVGFKIDTTIYAKFETSDRRKEDIEISSNSGKSFLNQLRSELTFNKPLLTINYDSLYIKYDTAGIIPITPENVQLPDSTKRTKLLINIYVPDSLKYETFTVFAADSTFQDVENQWNKKKLEANYKKLKAETLADGITGTVATDERPIIIQLLNKREEVLQQKYLQETNAFEFTNIEAGDYKIRAIIDRNKNSRWDPGNYYENRQPEPIYYFINEETQTDEFLLRGGWTLNDIVIQPRRHSGIFSNRAPLPPPNEIEINEREDIKEPVDNVEDPVDNGNLQEP